MERFVCPTRAGTVEIALLIVEGGFLVSVLLRMKEPCARE